MQIDAINTQGSDTYRQESVAKIAANKTATMSAAGDKGTTAAETRAELVSPTRLDALARAQTVVDDAGSQAQSQGMSLKFRVLEDSNGVQVEMVDPNNDKVVRKIPSDELLKLAESIKSQGSLLLDRIL